MNPSSLKPNREHLISNWPKYWFWLILIIAFVVITFTFNDYGVSWDESAQAKYGDLVIDYFQSGFKNKEYSSFLNLRYYGPLFEIIPALIFRFVGEWQFEIRHFCIALTALLTIAGVMKYGSLFRDPFVPFFASLSLIMLPRFYGHAFINSKDVPFACLFAWAMYFIASLFYNAASCRDHNSARKTELDGFRRKAARRVEAMGGRAKLSFADNQTGLPPWKQVVYTGLAIGLALSTRIGGFLLFFFLAAAGIFGIVNQSFSLKNTQRDKSPQPNGLVLSLSTSALCRGLSIFAVAWIVMVIFWPWAHENPIMNPFRAFKEAIHFQDTYPIFFEGRFVQSNRLPWYYLPKYLLITTPVIIVACCLLGAGRSIYEVVRTPKSSRSLLYFITQLWFFFPVAYFMVKRPNIYDGVRHFLFILPSIAVFAGIGAAFIRESISVRYRKTIFFVLTVAILMTAFDLIRLHPYQIAYYNGFVGGLKEAGKKYETEYWTSSYKEAVEWVNENTNPARGQTTVLVAANGFNRLCAEYYGAPHLKIHTMFTKGLKGSLPPKVDYYIATTRYGFDRNFPDTPVVHTIGRDNTVFTVIKKRKK